jgi:hypothetical protein
MPARHARPKPAGRWAVPVAAACVAVAALTSGPLPWLMLPAAAAATILGLRQADRRAEQARAAADQAAERVRAAEAGADSWRAEADFLSAELAALAAELAATRTPPPAMSEPSMASSGYGAAQVAPEPVADPLQTPLPAAWPAAPEPAGPGPAAAWPAAPALQIHLPDTPISAPPITPGENFGAQPAGWQGVRVIDLVVRETRFADSAA